MFFGCACTTIQRALNGIQSLKPNVIILYANYAWNYCPNKLANNVPIIVHKPNITSYKCSLFFPQTSYKVSVEDISMSTVGLWALALILLWMASYASNFSFLISLCTDAGTSGTR